uniref:glutathione transferase n=1 Tax=Sparassis latifolia TaxID=1202976 RepID=A0A2U8JGN4_9APHY|nr:glutathione transferase-like protein [Sparassis latifolia]
MSHGKQFTLFSHPLGPNGIKVAIVLEELGLTYEAVYLSAFEEGDRNVKGPLHTKYNPNGRIPTLIDHRSSDFVVWESDAILTYLVERYDAEHKISVTDLEDKITQLQWLFFQASGQGPYFGQAGWFTSWHPEKLPSAIERYRKEVLRVFGVLNSVLSKQEWLVGGKCTVADLSFIPFNVLAITDYVADYNGFDFARDFPAVFKWHNDLVSREAVRKVYEIKDSFEGRVLM